MKKLIICLAVATIAVSCKKIQAGGNKGTLKLEEGVERYSDDEQTSGHEEDLNAKHVGADHGEHEAETPKTDSTRAQKSPEVTTSGLEKPSAEQH
ncbi:hypothetical protein [Chryseobacterium chendengshani]|uniref:hypothetical protein n=1 Tax=unclassified Chryseobacterium TaxID=2593645 RepID=UPI001C641DE1|nr:MULTISPECIES: hypothetical protein [unclassified Chryseobacterium]MBW7674637.1 hypothetical protein [Chryseobacterium sp. LJ756]MBW8522571.1 hypothetical protein [Chryseobacterium sp. LJ668]QYK16108.1 hypothetical protein K0U91_13760 [Chryseobacterium sp. LJ668]